MKLIRKNIIGTASNVNITSTLLSPVTPTAIPFNAQAIEELKEITRKQAELQALHPGMSARALRRAEARKLKPKYR